MSIEGQKFYPGETATPQQLLKLADEYRCAAKLLLGSRRRGEPLSLAPYRLLAIHGIELYLSALLRASGQAPAKLRSMHHDLAQRAEFGLVTGLQLRKRTLAHLHALSQTREYLVTRYDPTSSVASQLNRLEATLDEIADKVVSIVERRPE